MSQTRSNYETMKIQMQDQFLKYDQSAMIQKFNLRHDKQWLYIRFVQREYRIGRNTGIVEWSDDDFQTTHNADYNEAMTIYDVLCCSKDYCKLSGSFVPVNSLKGTVKTAGGGAGNGLFKNIEQFFDENFDKLKSACEKLQGSPEKVGDVSYKLRMFDFLPVILQFWQSDDEFPACLKIMWDENILDYMHYETTWFAAGHLLSRLKEEMS